MKESINKLIAIFLCITFFMLFFGGPKVNLKIIEDLDIYIGSGNTIKKIGEDSIEYIISTTSNIYKGEDEVESETKVGRALTVGGTREDRQRKIGRSFFLGLTKLYLVDEEYGREGIKNILDILFKNAIINDTGAFVVCNGNSQDYYKFKQEGYENNAEYIANMIENSSVFNFFGENYSLKNAELSMDSEGRNIVCPYIRLTEKGIKIDGSAVFKKDKLALILDINETRIMSMLRENKSKGILTIQKKSQDYIDYEAKVKRKVKCTKVGDKYSFIIELQLKGDILNNLLYKKMTEKIDVVKEFEEDMTKDIEKKCNEFIKKMQNEYKIDCLQLGWIAAGKYGRDTGVDWDEVISKSDIKVKIKVKVDNLGRGEFRIEE